MDTSISRPAARGLIFVVLAGILWGTSGVATKAIYSMIAVSPTTVAAFRLALGAPLLLAAVLFTTGYRSFRGTRSDLGLVLLVGAALGVSQACYFAAIAQVGVAVATLVTICTAPVLVSLLGAGMLHERPARATIAALFAALIGTALLVGVSPGTRGAAPGAMLEGVFFALGAAVCFTFFILGGRLLARRYGPLQSIALAASTGGALLLAVSAVTTGIRVDYALPVWGLFLYLGLAPTALGYALFFHGVKHTTAAEASIASLAEPLTSTALALVLFGERLGPWGAVGAGLLIGVLVFLYRNGGTRSGKPLRHAPPK